MKTLEEIAALVASELHSRPSEAGTPPSAEKATAKIILAILKRYLPAETSAEPGEHPTKPYTA